MKAIIVLAVLVTQVMAEDIDCQSSRDAGLFVKDCVNGQLTGNGATADDCLCDCAGTGHYGELCETECTPISDGSCHTCDETGLCTDGTCTSGYVFNNNVCNPRECSIDDSNHPDKINCVNGEAAGLTGDCSCECADTGYYGTHCEIECPAPDNANSCQDCTEMGVCTKAVCASGYKQSDDDPGVCELKDCTSEINCQNSGVAGGSPGSCYCDCQDTGHYGTFCEETCPVPDNANGCVDCTNADNTCTNAVCETGYEQTDADPGVCEPQDCIVGSDTGDPSQLDCQNGAGITGKTSSCQCTCDNTEHYGTLCDTECNVPNYALNCLTCDNQGTCTDADCKPGYDHNSGSCIAKTCTQGNNEDDVYGDDSKIICENSGEPTGNAGDCGCNCVETGYFGTTCDTQCVNLDHGTCDTCTGPLLAECEAATCHETHVAFFNTDNVFQGCLLKQTCSDCLSSGTCNNRASVDSFCAPGKTELSDGICVSGICSQDDCCKTDLCGENEYVSNNKCVSCPEFQHNDAGDNPTGADTQCDFNSGCADANLEDLCTVTGFTAPKPDPLPNCAADGACTPQECCAPPRSCNDDYPELDCTLIDPLTPLDSTRNIANMIDLYSSPPPIKNKADLEKTWDGVLNYKEDKKLHYHYCCEFHDICGDTFSEVCGSLEHDISKIYKACPATGCSASECCIPASSPEKFSVVFQSDFNKGTAEKILVKIPSSRQGDFNVGDTITYGNQLVEEEYIAEVTAITQVTTTPAASGGSRRRREDEDVFLEISINPALETDVKTGEGTIVESKLILQQEAAKKSSKTKAKTSDKNSMNDGEKFALVLGIGAGFLFLLSFFNE